MEQKEIIEGNKAIAVFMGWEIEKGMEGFDNPFYTNDGGFSIARPSSMYFHTSWDWLMPAWYKFRDLKFDDTKTQIEHSSCKQAIAYQICYGTIEQAFIEMFTSINWYTQTKQK